MTASYFRNHWLLFGAALSVFVSRPALAQAPADATSTQPSAPEAQPLPAYHHSSLSWEHSVTTATVGVGDTPQSANPTYTMGLLARGRYYLLEDATRGKYFSLRLDGGLYREFTNSDETTRRGEWLFSDTDLAGVYVRRLRGASESNGTFLEVRPLTLTLPTSKASFESGRYVAPGVLLGVGHVTPLLAGRVHPDVVSTLRLAVGYKRWLARATVPTNASLDRVRLTPDGRSLPGDSLSGSALVRDQLDISASLRLSFGQSVLWTTAAAFAPAWKYSVANDVELCGVVLTGCTDVKLDANDTRRLVRTQFSTEVSVRIARAFSVELGYGNTANQLAPDGRRRGFLYSPASVFYASVSFFPHELVRGSKQLAETRNSSPRL